MCFDPSAPSNQGGENNVVDVVDDYGEKNAVCLENGNEKDDYPES